MHTNKNRNLEFNRKNNLKKYWNVSLKYSTILLNNIDNKNLHLIINSIYGSFLKELKSNKLLDFKNNWKELLNINSKNKFNEHNVISSTKKLHLTNIYNVNKYF